MSKRVALLAIVVSLSGLVLLFIHGNGANGVTGEDRQGVIKVSGRKRTFLIHLPPAYGKAQSLPVVLAFHGGGGSGQKMRSLTIYQWDVLANKEGFIVVYADGINHQWNDGRPEVNSDIDDVGFVSALIEHLVQNYKADRKRIYATGISNGGLFSFRLACELSDKIAAIASVVGLMGEVLSKRCSPKKPVPVLLIAGTDDPFVPWKGGEIQVFGRKLGRVLSAEQTVALWVKQNGCTMTPTITYEPDKDPNDGTKVRREEYGGGKEGSEVIFYVIEGGGHTWPSGLQYLPERIVGKTSRDINACEVIWQFFKRHKRNKGGSI